MNNIENPHLNDIKFEVEKKYRRKGIVIAICSGMSYGLYSAFLTFGMSQGVWADWYGDNSLNLSVFVVTFVLGALGSAINDTCSAIWSIVIASIKGKIVDLKKCFFSKPGLIMALAALVGGPIASTAYVVALQMAGSIIIPITALCPAIGAILSRILFKQQLNFRIACGIGICIFASILIGSTAMSDSAPQNLLLGCLIAFIAALGWGIEGCIAGYGTVLIDYEIGITIRQTVSGITNLIVLVPLMCLISGDVSLAPKLTIMAVSSWPSMLFFIISGFCAVYAYSLWYKGNSMCGTALGMACNGMYSFWGPFFCWLVIGVFFKQDGWALQPIAWIAAIIMIIGIFLIAVNPITLFKGEK